MSGYVNIDDFMDHLKRKGLVIVSRAQLLDTAKIDLDILRRDLMKRTDISIKDIVDAKLLPVDSKSGVRSWIASGKIRPTEIIKTKAGNVRILTSAIKRLGYAG